MSRTNSQVSISDETPTSVASMRHAACREVREHRGDLLRLQEVDQAQQHRLRVVRGAARDEVADRIDDHRASAAKLDHELVDLDEVRFEAVQRGPRGVQLQQCRCADHGSRFDADRAHVADQLARRLLERENTGSVRRACRSRGEVRREARLARAGRAASRGSSEPR